MATNKNQHFVPRCYLRQFTAGEGNKVINLYNVERDRFIEGAPVKNQCSGDYFYGKDPLLEDIIQTFERSYASAAREIILPGYELTDDHRNTLRLFWLIQYFRTEAASRRSVEMSDAMASVIGLDGAEFKLQIREAVQMAMQHFSESMEVVSDLGICLVRNQSRVPFITSDDPAILSNRWRLQHKKRGGFSFGLNSAGALLFLPISPTIMCLGYDRDMYSVQHRDGWVRLDRDSDADAFNQHQYLNCRANLFVKESEHFNAIRSGFKAVSKNRLPARHRINYAILDKTVNGHDRFVVVDRETAEPHANALVHNQVIFSTPAAWPRQIGWRAGAHYYFNGSGVGYIRYAATNIPVHIPFEKVRAFR